MIAISLVETQCTNERKSEDKANYSRRTRVCPLIRSCHHGRIRAVKALLGAAAEPEYIKQGVTVRCLRQPSLRRGWFCLPLQHGDTIAGHALQLPRAGVREAASLT